MWPVGGESPPDAGHGELGPAGGDVRHRAERLGAPPNPRWRSPGCGALQTGVRSMLRLALEAYSALVA